MAFCFAQFFIPFALVLLPLDLAGGTQKSLLWFLIGLGGLLIAGMRFDLTKLFTLVFLLAAAFSWLLLLRVAIDCTLLSKAVCESLTSVAYRAYFLGAFGSGYLLVGWALRRRTKNPKLKV